MRCGLGRSILGVGLVLALGCGGKAVTTGESSGTGSGGDGTGGDTSGSGSDRTTTSGGTGGGGSTSDPPPRDPPPRDPPVPVPDPPDEPEPPDLPPDEPEPPDPPPDVPDPPDPPPDVPDPPDPPDDPMLPGDCTTGFQTAGQGWCELEMECNNRYAYVWCDGDGDQSSYCYCYGDRFYGDFAVTGVGTDQSCDVVVPYCLGAELDLGETTCEPTYQDSGVDYCSSEAQCSRSVQVNDDVTLEAREWRYVWCEDSGSAWTCGCSSNFDSITIDFEGANGNICPDALMLCIDGELEASGPKDCQPRRQSASQTYCDAELDCTQQGTLGGVPVNVHSSTWMYCEAIEEGVLHCICQLDGDSTEFDVDGDDVWGTCQVASQICSDEASG